MNILKLSKIVNIVYACEERKFKKIYTQLSIMYNQLNIPTAIKIISFTLLFSSVHLFIVRFKFEFKQASNSSFRDMQFSDNRRLKLDRDLHARDARLEKVSRARAPRLA